jgi:hypothetical protein
MKIFTRIIIHHGIIGLHYKIKQDQNAKKDIVAIKDGKGIKNKNAHCKQEKQHIFEKFNHLLL